MKISPLLRTSVVLAALAATSSAFAGFFSYNGDTTGGPTYTRTVENGTALSIVGTGVRYDAQQFTVSVAGNYLFSSLSVLPQGWDNFTFLYSTFDPSDALSGYLAGSDDFTDVGTSAFSATLTPGTYTFVTTGYSNGNFGSFSNSILGPGTITPTPEPATMAALGLGAFALLRRRRSR